MNKVILAGTLIAALAAGSAIAAPAPGSSPRAPGSRILRIDTNGDGIVTIAELEQSAVKRFKKLDTNGDGNLTRDELEAPHARWVATHPQAAQNPQRRGRGGDRFARLDTDHNGLISFGEFSVSVSKRAERLDTNHDGQISRDEFVAARAAYQSHRRGRRQDQGQVQTQS